MHNTCGLHHGLSSALKAVFAAGLYKAGCCRSYPEERNQDGVRPCGLDEGAVMHDGLPKGHYLISGLSSYGSFRMQKHMMRLGLLSLAGAAAAQS